MKTRRAILLILTLILSFGIIACNTKFDKKQWNEQVEPASPPFARSGMVDDLITNHKLVGLSYTQLIENLGIPDSKDSNTISYNITVDYGWDIDPVYMKNLEFTVSKDSMIRSFKVIEWRK